jgi:hypothetical protein
LLDINSEGDLLRENKDIMDELFIMSQIKMQEETVARTFVKHVQRMLLPGSYGDASIDNRSEHSFSSLSRGKRVSQTLLQSPAIQFGPNDDSVHCEDIYLTLSSARELLDSMNDQILELKYLKDAAENTSLALKDLLALKQQQAGVVEARESVKQGEETLRQGRAIMLFTIITIVFVSLYFCLPVDKDSTQPL